MGIPNGRFSFFPGLGIHTRRVGLLLPVSFNCPERRNLAFGDRALVESRGAIMLRPSLLDRSVRVSLHCAPEYL